jgi:MFS family permease
MGSTGESKAMRVRGIVELLLKRPFVIALIPVAIITQCAFASIICILPLYFEECKAPKIFTGLVISAFALVETLFKAPSGALGDRYGRLRVMLTGLGIATCATALMSAVKTWYPFLLLHPIVGFSAAMIWTSLTASFLDFVPMESKATALGLDNFCYLVGVVIGVSSAFFIRYSFGGSKVVFAFASLILLMASVIVVSLLRYHVVTSGGQRSKLSFSMTTLHSLAKLFRNKSMLLLALVLGLVQFSIAVQIPVLPIYAHRILKLTDAQISVSVFAIALLLSLMALPLSRLADVFPRLLVMRSALLIGAVVFALAPRITSMPLLLLLGMLTGGAWVMGFPAVLATVDDIAVGGERGLSLGFATTAQGIGFIVGPFSGSIALTHSFSAPFAISSCSLLTAFALTIMIGRQLRSLTTQRK